jgi:hypothetical protein
VNVDWISSRNLFSAYRGMDPKLSHSITLFLGKLLACNKKRTKFLSAYEIQQLLKASSSGMVVARRGGGGSIHSLSNGYLRPPKSSIKAMHFKYKHIRSYKLQLNFMNCILNVRTWKTDIDVKYWPLWQCSLSQPGWYMPFVEALPQWWTNLQQIIFMDW